VCGNSFCKICASYITTIPIEFKDSNPQKSCGKCYIDVFRKLLKNNREMEAQEIIMSAVQNNKYMPTIEFKDKYINSLDDKQYSL
jgi:hypothetical protein